MSSLGAQSVILLLLSTCPWNVAFVPTVCHLSTKPCRLIGFRTRKVNMATATADARHPDRDACGSDDQIVIPIFDAHCHIQLSSRTDDITAFLSEHNAALMGTRPADWDATEKICLAHPERTAMCLGLHPWYAHSPGDDGWLLSLRHSLLNHPEAIVGEIGLDKQWIPPECTEVQYEAQMKAFKAQLDLATELNRPVSLHCVHAQGDMFDMLRGAAELPPAVYFHSFGGKIPPAVYFHSFGGKVGMADSFVKMRRFGSRFYFGFSAFANGRSPKTPEVVK